MLTMLAIVAWLVVSIGGGLVVGRLIRVASRRRRVA
jgi:F0F1-type ATP synthase membrane subunit c/vacuolar-type H+-ATPase subunit K